MAARVRDSVAPVLGTPAAELVHRAVLDALRARHELDPQDARYLHPGRVPLILLEDGGVRDEAVLAAGALLETHHLELAGAPARLDARAVELLAQVPRPDLPDDQDELREALVTAPDDVRLLALVERLDHARHLHMYPEPEWRAFYDNIRAAYLPVAEWRGGLLGARYRRWADAFARRLGSA